MLLRDTSNVYSINHMMHINTMHVGGNTLHFLALTLREEHRLRVLRRIYIYILIPFLFAFCNNTLSK
jgi:hypothetical protein